MHSFTPPSPPLAKLSGFFNGFVETIFNVFYVPYLKSNLLSVGQLQEKGYVITIQKGACEIYDFSRRIVEIV